MNRRLFGLPKGSLRYEDWNIGVVFDPIERFLDPNFAPCIRWFPKPAGIICADPFGVSLRGKLYVFFEAADYRHSRGVISCTELRETAWAKDQLVALDLPTHISHPYIFEHQGEIFCLPETAGAREIALFRCHQFPQSWKKASTLIARVPGVDGTPFRHEERWWLFFTIRNGSVNSDLYAWHARDLFGPWQPHQKNPVKRDAGSVRPAGTPFVYRGILYRPGQDCSKKYGRRVIINRIIRLTPDHFAEEEAATVGPFEREPFPSGIHTISAVEKITLIDGKRYRFKATAALQSALRLRRPRPRR